MSTIKEIAQRSGYACSTVSYALRGHSRIPPETRLRIEQVAKEMGYQPDAHLKQLMTYLRGRGRGRHASVCPLVWINSTSDPEHWQKTPWAKEFFLSASQHADELGFALSDFWVRDHKIPPSRIDGILKARGTKGLIMSAPLQGEQWSQWIDWNAYAAVIVDDPFGLPQFDRVFADYATNMRDAIEHACARGYKRPKVWLTEREDYWTAHGYTYECLRQNQLRPEFTSILPEYASELSTHQVKAWMERHQPDVVIAPTPSVGLHLQKLGFHMPQDVGYIAMYMLNEDTSWSGFSQLHAHQAIIAIERLALLLQNNSLGRQTHPQKIQIAGEWREGTTLRPPTFAPVQFSR